MRIAYFDCFSGASGNMILGALVDAGLDPEQLERELAKLQLDEFTLHFERHVKHAISGTHLEVEVHMPQTTPSPQREGHQHAHEPHRHLVDILEILDKSALDVSVKARAQQIFERLAEAEARIHHRERDQVHLHEVSGVDSIVDVVGSVIGLELLGVEAVYVSPIALGRGFVRCAHGLMPLPAPGTLELLKGIPVQPTDIPHELTTPTGAAILSTLGQGFGPMPPMAIERIGYGAGTRDLEERPNLLRVCLGVKKKQPLTDQIVVLETNIDDMSAETFGYVSERLLEKGALDVFTSAIFMKKNRPAILLTVLAEEAKAFELAECILRETTTFGIRTTTAERWKLQRQSLVVETPYGPVRVKQGFYAGRLMKAVPEYEDCRRLAREQGVPFRRVYQAAEQAAQAHS